MKLKSVFAGFLSLAMAAVLLAGCANQMEPAKKAIADIEAAVAAAGPDAAQYIPDQLQAVTSQIADLKMKFDQKDYKGVIAAAPALLTQAQGLAAEAGTAKQAAEAAALQALNSEWSTLSTDLPAQLAAVTKLLTCCSRQKSHRPQLFCIMGKPTRSPTWRSVTPSPIATTSPTPSCPSTSGNSLNFNVPWASHRSVPQIPQAWIRTSTWPAPTCGRSRFCNSHGPFSLATTTAFIRAATMLTSSFDHTKGRWPHGSNVIRF